MIDIPEFQNKKMLKKDEQQKDNNSQFLNLNEEEEEYQTNENNISYSKKYDIDSDIENCESMEDSLDEERFTLDKINKDLDKKRIIKRIEEIKEERLLNKKRKDRKDDYEIITYNKKKRKLENIFCATIEELNEFLINCQVKRISYQDFSPYTIIKSQISFDPIEWMKSNNMYQRTLSLEDLSLYCQNQINEKKNSNKKVNIKKEKENENEIKIKKEYFIKIEPNFKDKKILDNYDKLKTIILFNNLSNEQKDWINDFISEISKINIENINIEKNKEGKDNKLEIVLDLDNTCVFSFLSNEDNLFVQSKKYLFPKKGVKMISFNYNNRVIYTILIIRKGLKEFIKYVEPLCNFHISTLSYNNYGDEIKKILSESFNIEFSRYKARYDNNEFTKKIEDLLIEKEKTIIFDDNVNVWINKDNEHVINTKFFYDEECAMINLIESNEQDENLKYSKENFLKTYRFFYNKIKEKNNNNSDWKEQIIKECFNIPFYQFKLESDFDYNKCYTAEYLNSTKLQFTYMKNVIKEIYYLKFVYGLDIAIAIKLIRISTLNNMIFNLKFLDYMQKNILTDIVKSCGGIIYNESHQEKDKKDKKVYLVISINTGLKNKKEVIKKYLIENPFLILINERFILDTYYFMTNLKDNINDPEYIINKSEYII